MSDVGPSASDRALAVAVPPSSADAGLDAAWDRPTYLRAFLAFAPLLRRWGQAIEVSRPESRLDYVLWRFQEQGSAPLHLSFIPLQEAYLSARARNVAFVLWSLPDFPPAVLVSNPRLNWALIANRLSLLITAHGGTRDAFARAGVTAPIHVVPVPVQAELFALPPFERHAVTRVVAQAYPLSPGERTRPTQPNPWLPSDRERRRLPARARRLYQHELQTRLPNVLQRWISTRAHSVRAALAARRQRQLVAMPAPRDGLELSGVVYTSFVDPFDRRDAWDDLLSAFLLALGDREDATLVLRLLLTAERALNGVRMIVERYRRLGIAHRCRLVVVAGDLPPTEELSLARASAYYVNAVRAASVCLPLQEFLAAGRPGISPRHTAMADYFHDGIGFSVEAHPEPTGWPDEPGERCSTRQFRLVWQSLYDQIGASYAMVVNQPPRYRAMEARAREEMSSRFSEDRIWPLLSAALDTALGDPAPAPALRRT